MLRLEWWQLHWAWFFGTAAAAVLVKLVLRWIRLSVNGDAAQRDLPSRILTLRRVTGEIDKNEYRRQLTALRKLRHR